MWAFVTALVLQRLAELAWSTRNARRLSGRGVREFGGRHFLVFVMLHALYPLTLACEVLILGARPGPAWPLWLAVCVAAQALRVWAIAALGPLWNVRVRVVPGMTPIRRGPYHFIPHPNYLAVALEFVAGPLMFGAWRTAIAFSLLNAVAMAVRIPVEERALAWAATQPPEAPSSAGS